MVRSTKVSIRFANVGKRKAVSNFILEYRRVASLYVEALWNVEKLPPFIPASLKPAVETWLSARALQGVGKQVSAVIRGTRGKNEKREFVRSRLEQEGKHRQARKLQRIISAHPAGKPDVSTMNPELDERFLFIDLTNTHTKSFDGWLQLGLGDNKFIELPFNKHRHLNKLANMGKLRPCVSLSDEGMVLVFAVPDVPARITGKILGVDVGVNALLSCSDGRQIKQDGQGQGMVSISQKLARKRRGNRSFRKASAHRENFIGWAVRQVDLSNTKQVNIEKIRNLRTGKHTNRLLSHFVYPLIFGRLKNLYETTGVRVCEVSSVYTSQRCAKCGWTRKANRRGELFTCGACGNIGNADVNASINISFNLPGISRKERLRRPNLKGFYWLAEGQEHIVPDVRKT